MDQVEILSYLMKYISFALGFHIFSLQHIILNIMIIMSRSENKFVNYSYFKGK